LLCGVALTQNGILMPAAAAGLAPGTYLITSGTQAVDGGFGYWGDVPAVQFYPLASSNPMQQWTWNGSTLQNVGYVGEFMVDAGNGTVSESTSGDTWSATAANGGYRFKNSRTGKYLSNVSGTLAMSASASVWSVTGLGTGGAGLTSGTYLITSRSQAIDGGFGYWGDVPAVQMYPTAASNPFQQWQWNGSALQNVGFSGEFMVDAGNGTVSESTSGDTWSATAANGGYTFKNSRTGKYLSNASGTLAMSASASVWSVTGLNTGGVGLTSGTYLITSGSQAVDGGFGYWGDVPAVQIYPTAASNPFQQWQWNGSALQNVGFSGEFMVDAGNGTVSESTSGDTWSATAANGGYTVKNSRTGKYLSLNSGVLAMSGTASVWTFTPSSSASAIPSVPTGLSGTAASSTQVRLSWNACTGNVAGYYVYRNNTNIGQSTTSTYQDSNLSPSATYSYSVAAFDSAGHVSAQSSAVSVTTQAGTTQAGTPPPPIPTGLTAVALSSSQVQLSWNAPTGSVSGYYVYRNGGMVGTSSTATYLDPSLSALTTYSYSVSAFNQTGASAQSSPISVTTQAAGGNAIDVTHTPYFAVGDGSSDSTNAIQSAINACPSGGSILFPAGTYKLSAPLSIRSNCTYLGQGQAELRGYTGTGPGGFELFYGNSIQNVTITGLTFNGGGVYMDNSCSNLTFTNNTVKNILSTSGGTNTDGLFLVNTSIATITGNTFQNLFYGGDQTAVPAIGWGGVHVAGFPNRVHVNNNIFDHIGANGIAMPELYCSVGSCDDNEFNGNTFTNVHRMTIELMGNNLTNTQVKNNTMSNYLNPYYDTFGISFAVYDTSAVISGNKMDATVPAPSGERYGYCIEIAGVNTLVDSNVCSSSGSSNVANQWVSGFAIAPSPAANNLTISNNKFCGPMGYAWADPTHSFLSYEGTPPTANFVNNTIGSCQ
jgi:chitodextrinase